MAWAWDSSDADFDIDMCAYTDSFGNWSRKRRLNSSDVVKAKKTAYAQLRNTAVSSSHPPTFTHQVLLHFDDELENKIFTLLTKLKTNGIITPLDHRHGQLEEIFFKQQGQGWRPCLIMKSKSKVYDPEICRPVFENFASTHDSVPISFASVLVEKTSDTYSLSLAAKPSKLLVDLFQILRQQRLGAEIAHGSWGPLRLQIACSVPQTQVAEVMNLALGNDSNPYQGNVARIGAVGLSQDSTTTRTITYSFPLRKI